MAVMSSVLQTQDLELKEEFKSENADGPTRPPWMKNKLQGGKTVACRPGWRDPLYMAWRGEQILHITIAVPHTALNRKVFRDIAAAAPYNIR